MQIGRTHDPVEAFMPPFPRVRYIERLGVMPAGGGPAASGKSALDDTLALLRSAGFACSAKTTPRLHLLGGTGMFAERGISGYESPFSILQEGSQFTVMVSGASGQQDEERTAGTLEEAAQIALAIYHARGISS